MSFAELKLFAVADVSRENMDIPVFTSASDMEIYFRSGGVFQSYDNVKVRCDLAPQTVTVDMDASYLREMGQYNMACLKFLVPGSNPAEYYYQWYWITGYREVTCNYTPDMLSDGMHNVAIDLEYIPVTTSITLASDVSIIPERLPSETDYVVQNWTDSIMVKTAPNTAIPDLPKLPSMKHFGAAGDADRVMWCEINFKSSADTLNKYGFFVFTEGNGTLSREIASNVQYDAFSIDGSTYHYPVYPSLVNVIKDPNTYTGIPASDIFSITVSEFCPYKTIQRAGAGQAVLRVGDNTEIAGTQVASVTQSSGGITYSYDQYVYDLTNDLMISSNNPLPSSDTTVTVTLNDYEKHNGQLYVRDSMRNKTLAIPKELNTGSMELSVHTYSDLNNIYTVIKYADITVTLPGYLIPWTGSGWDTYRSFNLEYDRQALQNNIDQTNMQALTSIGGGAAAGMIMGSVFPGIGNVTGAVIGAGTAAAGVAITNYAKMKEQELTEQRMKNSPGSINNPAYGYGVCDYVAEYGGAELILELPAGFDKDTWEDQTAIWGFPSNKILQTAVSITEGYWQGMITSASTDTHAMMFGLNLGMIINSFKNGVRLKKIE